MQPQTGQSGAAVSAKKTGIQEVFGRLVPRAAQTGSSTQAAEEGLLCPEAKRQCGMEPSRGSEAVLQPQKVPLIQRFCQAARCMAIQEQPAADVAPRFVESAE